MIKRTLFSIQRLQNYFFRGTLIDPDGATVTYALSSGDKLPAGLEIDESTGKINGQAKAVSELDTYSVTVIATATGKNYKGKASANVQIEVYRSEKPKITGELDYPPIYTDYGKSASQEPTTKSLEVSNNGESYTLTNAYYSAFDGTSQLAHGITIDGNTGEVIVTNQAEVMSNKYYDVHVTDRNDPDITKVFPNAVSVTVYQKNFESINVFKNTNSVPTKTVQAFTANSDSIHEYLSDNYTVGTHYTLNITPQDPDQNINGAISITRFNADPNNNGTIQINDNVTVADAGVYTIIATGKGNYTSDESSKTLEWTLNVEPKDFGSINVFTDQTSGPTKTVTAFIEDNDDSIPDYLSNTYGIGTDFVLRIKPVNEARQNINGAISINPLNGKIQINKSVSKADAGNYTIIATGRNNYSEDDSSIELTWTLNVEQNEFTIGAVGPAGGIVFYDKEDYSDGWRYLEAATSDHQDMVEWGGLGTSVGGTSTDIGSGKANTEKIVQTMGNGNYNDDSGNAVALDGNYAAKICYEFEQNGYDDWFLPSRDELNALFLQRVAVGSLSYYWSSSELSANPTAIKWGQDFRSIGFPNISKADTLKGVRAVRAF